MADWAKFKFFYDTMLGSPGSTLVATSTESSDDFDVDYIHNMLETNRWKAAANPADPQYITYDAGLGITKTADYLAIHGHNLRSAGANVVLQNSSDNFVADINDVIALLPGNDSAFVEEARMTVNGEMESWSAGPNSIPDGWKTHYGGELFLRLAGKSGFGVRLKNAVSSAGGMRQDIEDFTDHTYYRGKTVTFGCWVQCSTASRARIAILDDNGQASSSMHSGGGGWEFLTVSKTVHASATYLRWFLQITTGTQITADFDGAIAKVASSVSSTDVSDYIQPSSNAKRYWRLKVAGYGTTSPDMAVCIWGDKTELDYASASFDPHHQEETANVNLSYGGYVTGIHTRYTERRLDLRINDADPDLYDKLKSWWDTHGLKNLFVAWDTAKNPSDVWLMRSSGTFRNPFNRTGLYRDINIKLSGRKE